MAEGAHGKAWRAAGRDGACLGSGKWEELGRTKVRVRRFYFIFVNEMNPALITGCRSVRKTQGEVVRG